MTCSVWGSFYLLPELAKYFDFAVIEKRERIQRFDNVLSIYIYNEDNAKHNRPHAHITLNNNKIGEIYIDTWEIHDRNGSLNKNRLNQINEWLKDNKQKMVEEWQKCNHKIDILF